VRVCSFAAAVVVIVVVAVVVECPVFHVPGTVRFCVCYPLLQRWVSCPPPLHNRRDDASGLHPSTRYVYQVKWADNTQVAVRTVNRAQNVSTLLLADVRPGGPQVVADVIHTETSNAWVEVVDSLTFFNHSGRLHFVDLSIANGYVAASITSAVRNRHCCESNGEGLDGCVCVLCLACRRRFRHVALYRVGQPATRVAWLTSGAWEVTSIVSVSTTERTMHYMSTQDGPTQRTLYRTTLLSAGARTRVSPLGWNAASFSPSGL